MAKSISKPISSVPPLTGYLGVVVIVALYFLWPHDLVDLSYTHQSVIFLLIVFTFMAAYELVFPKTYKAPEAELDFSQSFNFSKIFTQDFAVKIFGLLVSLALVSLYFWVADIYRADWYRRFFIFILDYFWAITLLVLAYFSFLHVFMRQANDSYWHLGIFILKRGREGDKILIRNHLLGLAIKAFFLPLMFCYYIDDWNYLRDFDWALNQGFEGFFKFSFRFLYFIDLAFVVMGYVFTARLFNAHIRWTEQRVGGWVICLLCYMPFWQIFGRSYLDYHAGGISWKGWLAEDPTLYGVWGSVILLLAGLYVLSEVQFGLRFSNLTYRGLISHGTFRFTKHPGYISKNLSWWMMGVPFIAVDWTIALRNSIALVGVNAVYVMRARYEERCLAEAPEYQEYKNYIDQKGLFSAIKISSLAKVFKKIKKN